MSEFVAAFRALGDPTRQRILSLLEQVGVAGCRVSDLALQIELTQPSVSHHLKILKQAGLLTSQRRGKEMHYAIDGEALRRCCGSFFSRFECCRPVLRRAKRAKKTGGNRVGS